jgi:iron uptake system EfeUOB component EfeO/EfeM
MRAKHIYQVDQINIRVTKMKKVSRMRDNNDVMANIKNNYQIKSHWLLIKINWRDSMLYSRIDRFND